MKNITKALILFVLLSVTSCDNSFLMENKYGDVITLGNIADNTIVFDGSSTQSTQFTVKSTVDWTISLSNLEWAEVMPLSGKVGEHVTVKVTTKSVNGENRRTGTIMILASEKVEAIRVSQNGYVGPGVVTYDSATVVEDGHPRLFLSGPEFAIVKNNIDKYRTLRILHKYVMSVANTTLSTPISERILSGYRLLNVSVQNVINIFYCSYAYRFTGNRIYSDRAIAEMLKAASFSDWNPEHFLDVAEMTFAMAIGYDWCYPAIIEEDRITIRNAIVTKGLIPGNNPSYYASWNQSSGNWNQVCNAGLTAGAIAVLEEVSFGDKATVQAIIQRAVETIEIPMAGYEPVGTYKEGPGYWNYGTGYNTIFLSLIEHYYGTDYGLLGLYPGFLKTGHYQSATMTPDYDIFGYADQAFTSQVNVAPFYLYNKTGDASYIYMTQRLIDHVVISETYSEHRRLLPAALIWGALGGCDLNVQRKPESLAYIGGGATPIASFRSDWENPDALFLGFKLGTPCTGHGHMDIGHFCFEAEGVQWSTDMGGEIYTNLEKAGIGLWDTFQSADRWKLMRCGLAGHSTISFSGQLQIVNGASIINDYSTDNENLMYAMSDMSKTYADQVTSVKRAVSLVNKQYAVIQDKIVTGDNATTYKWAMCSDALSAEFPSSGNMILSSVDGKKLYMTINAPVAVNCIQWSAQPTGWPSIESRNSQMFVGFEATLEPNTSYEFSVYLKPNANIATTKPYVFN